MIQPVVLRELYAVARSRVFRRDRMRIGVTGFLMFGLALLWVHLQGGSSAGPEIFQVLAWVIWGCCVLLGPSMTANTLSRERREGTLGLLFLTPMTAWDVAIGKLSSGAITSLYRLLTLTPMLACTLLLGGIMGAEVLAVIGCCLNTLLFALALGLLISSTQTDDKIAYTLTLGFLIVLILLPYLAELVLPIFIVPGLGPDSSYRLFSIAYPITVAVSGLWAARATPVPLITGVILQHALAWILLLLTARRLRGVALESPPSGIASLWQRLRQWWQYGSSENRSSARRRLMEIHPMVWLGLRHRRKSLYVWVMFALLGALMTLVAILLDDPRELPAFLTAYVFITLALIKFWMISETCTRLVEDRNSGALELIVTTPLSTTDWVGGQVRALRQVFQTPLFFAAGLSSLVLLYHFIRNDRQQLGETLWQLFVIVAVARLDLRPLIWVSISEALRSTSISGAYTRVISRVMLPAYLVAFVSYLTFLWIQLNGTQPVSPPGWAVLGLAWLGVNAVIDGLVANRAKSWVQRCFQEVLAAGGSTATEELVPIHSRARAKSPTRMRRFGVWLLRHPVVASLLLLGISTSGFITIRSRLWDARVEEAQANLWLAGIPKTLPPPAKIGQLNSSATVSALQDLLTEARRIQGKILRFRGVNDRYAATNRAAVDAKIKFHLVLADQLMKLPEDAHLPRFSPDGNPWANLPVRPLCEGAVVLALRLQRAIDDRDADRALNCYRSLFQVHRLLDELPSPLAGSWATRVAAEGVEVTRRWLNSNAGVRPIPAELSRLLQQAESWTNAQVRLRLMPAFLQQSYQTPIFTVSGRDRVLDFLTVSARKDAVMAREKLGEILAMMNGPESELLQQVAATVENGKNNPATYAGFGQGRWTHEALLGYLVKAHAIGRIRLARAALMVEDFREIHGRLPQDQDEIVSWKRTDWPTDPLSGKPLKFSVQDHIYRVEFTERHPAFTPLGPELNGVKQDLNVFEVKTWLPTRAERVS